MKKTNRKRKKFRNLFLRLINLFDRVVITPITKLILLITGIIKYAQTPVINSTINVVNINFIFFMLILFLV